MRRYAIASFVLSALLLGPLESGADMLDVIRSSLADDCSLEKYLAIVDDFNAYYKDKGYQTEIVVPLHSENQGVVIWIGRAASATAFGQAYDHWDAELVKSGSTVSKLSARFGACTVDQSRASYMTAR